MALQDASNRLAAAQAALDPPIEVALTPERDGAYELAVAGLGLGTTTHFVPFQCSVSVLALPPLVLGTRLPRQPGVSRFLLYFLFIGAGYILIEVALIQKFVLFLGQPAEALTVVIFSMPARVHPDPKGLAASLTTIALPVAVVVVVTPERTSPMETV